MEENPMTRFGVKCVKRSYHLIRHLNEKGEPCGSTIYDSDTDYDSYEDHIRALEHLGIPYEIEELTPGYV